MVKQIYHLPEDLETINVGVIEDLIEDKISEDAYIDYKGRAIPKDITNVICSFLNYLGGHIVFGVEEKENIPIKIVGIKRTDFSLLNSMVRTNIRPPFEISVNRTQIPWKNDRIILILHLPRIPGRYYESKRKFYVRIGDSSLLLKDEEINRWKANHPEKSDYLIEILEKLRKKPELVNSLQEDSITNFITDNEIELISELLPKVLPGIKFGIPKQGKRVIELTSELDILEKYIKKLDRNIEKTEVQEYLSTDWKWQRLCFMAGNFWALLDDHERAKIFYESLDQVDALLNSLEEISFESYHHLYNKGVVYYRLKMWEMSLESFNKALNLNPNAYLILNNIGIIFGALKDESRAITYFRKALSFDPRNTLVLENLGIAYNESHKWDKAIEIFDLLIKIEPDNVDILNNKAVALIKSGKLHKASKLIDRVLKIDPNYVDAMINKAKINQEQGRPKEGIKWLDRALEIRPDYGKAWNNKGSHLGELKDFLGALNCFEKAILYDADLAEPHINISSIYLKMKEYDSVSGAIERGLRLFPDRWELYANKLALQIELKQTSDAEETLTIALEKCKNSAELYTNKSLLLIQKGDLDGALSAINHSIKLNRKIANSWYIKAQLHSVKPTRRDVFQTYWSLYKTLNLKPNHKRALELQKKLTHPFLKKIFRLDAH